MIELETSPAAELLMDQCSELGLNIRITGIENSRIELKGPLNEQIIVELNQDEHSMIEQVLRKISIRFDELPILTVGESKEIRLLTPKISLARLIPSVYSFTQNRCGIAPGTEIIRARFSAEVFRTAARYPGPRYLSTAFLGLIESPQGPLLAERVVEPSNVEVRVKRYHIGSPVHRYRFADRHSTAHNGPPLIRWFRFQKPVVCFDWRHPMHDEEGNRLADEPISDDYADVWLDNAVRAKELARDTFEWLEALFARRGLHLIDICFFIDKTGTVIYGEISPDCMRVRNNAEDDSESLDKDEWRSGGEATEVLNRYQRLNNIIFNT